MQRLMMLFLVSSLTSCATVKRPNIELCIMNGPALQRKCYNLATDYDDNGNLKKSAKPVYKTNSTIMDLNKALVIDSPDGFEEGIARLKLYIRALRKEAERSQQQRICQ